MSGDREPFPGAWYVSPEPMVTRGAYDAAVRERDRLAAALTEAERREGELREALRRYGHHDKSCRYGQMLKKCMDPSRHECNCGLLARSAPSTPAADKGEE